MIEEKIICDHCGRNIGNSISYPGYILNLRAIPHKLNEASDIYIINPLPSALDFCGFGCLRKYYCWDEK